MNNKISLLILCSLIVSIISSCKSGSQFQEYENMIIYLDGKIIELSDGFFGIDGKAEPFDKLSIGTRKKNVRYRLHNDSANKNEAEDRIKNYGGSIRGIFSVEKPGTSEDWSTVVRIVSPS